MEKYLNREIKSLASLVDAMESGIIPSDEADLIVLKEKLQVLDKLKEIHMELLIKNGFKDTYIFSSGEKKVLAFVARIVHSISKLF